MQIGTMELIVLLVVAFLVLGPERMVTYARKLGRFLRIAKVYLGTMTEDLKETVIEPLEELQEPLKEITKPLNDLTKETEATMGDIKRTVKSDPTPTQKTPVQDSEPSDEAEAEEDELEMAELVEEISDSQSVKADLDDAGDEKNEKTDLAETVN